MYRRYSPPTLTLDLALQRMLQQGADLTRYRQGLAERFGVPVEVVDTAIAAAGPARVVDPETVAQERLAEERRLRHTAAYRAWHHEEE